MHVVVSNEITVKNPSKDILNWAKAKLEFANPAYSKLQRLGKWVGNVPKKIVMYRMNGDDLIMPYGCFRNIIPFIEADEETTYEMSFVDNESVDYNAEVSLRDYQEEAVTEMCNCTYGILESPAGSGKTQMGIAMVAQLGKKTLWLTHTKDLLNQSMERALLYMDKDLIGTITEGKVNIGKGLTIATVQTLSKLDLTLYRNCFDVIIVDECHKVAGSSTSVTMFSKVLNNLAAKHKYGLSATITRADGLLKTTFSLLGGVIHRVPKEAVGNYIKSVEVRLVTTGLQISDELLEESTDGMINNNELISYLTQDNARNELILNYMKKCYFNHNIILSDRVEHLEHLREMLPTSFKDKAVVIHGKTNKKVRAQALEDMRAGKMKYLFATYQLASEGLDIPSLDRLFLVTPRTEKKTIIQSLGRIARICSGKGTPICYDFVDDIPHCIRKYKKRKTIYRQMNYEVKE